MKKKTVYLLRHGLTEANERHAYCGSLDLPLSERGRKELRELRPLYADVRSDIQDDEGARIITSGFLRTEETLELLFGAEISARREIVRGLRELDFGDFEGKTYEELKRRPDYQAWIGGDNERNICPHGESGEEMMARVCRVWRELVRGPEASLLVVSHGGPIAAVMQEVFPEEGRNRYEWQPQPGRGWQLVLGGGGGPVYESL